jgi:hypothetical protein
MRKYLWLAGLTLGLGLAGSAHAQFNVTVTPNIANNSAMDYRNQNTPIGATFYNPPNNGSSFTNRLASYFFTPSRTNTFASTTTAGHSTFPTPAQMQAAAPSYFQAFQMYRAQPIHP